LKRRSGAWVDATREHRDALEANLEAWKEAVRRSTSCSRAQASNIVAIAVLLDSEASADRFLRESCELELPWVRANRGRIRAVAMQPYFKS
jgi:hypothetical protein